MCVRQPIKICPMSHCQISSPHDLTPFFVPIIQFDIAFLGKEMEMFFDEPVHQTAIKTVKSA